MQPSHPTRERLINEAVVMLGEMPPEDIKVADVLRRSLATKGSLYHFFTDLSDLLEEAYLRRFGEQLELSINAIRMAVDRASTPEEFQQVLERVTAATQGAERAPMRVERARVIVMAQSNERFGKKLGVMQQGLTDALTECFAEAQNKGLLGKHFQPRTGAVLIQAYTLGRIVDDVGDGALDDEDWNRLINRLVLTLLADGPSRFRGGTLARMHPPQPGQVVTVFRSRLRPDNVAAYAEHAAQMSELARTMPGYLEHKAFTADDGERVTLVRFADRSSHEGWARHPDHREAQRAGIAGYYEEFSIAVGEIDHARTWTRDPADAAR